MGDQAWKDKNHGGFPPTIRYPLDYSPPYIKLQTVLHLIEHDGHLLLQICLVTARHEGVTEIDAPKDLLEPQLSLKDFTVIGIPGYILDPCESVPELLIIAVEEVIGLIPLFPLRVVLSMKVLIYLRCCHGDRLLLDHHWNS